MEKIVLTNMCLIQNPHTLEVVVIHRVKDWCGIAFPGGHIEEGEPIVPSVIREIKEETNLEISNLEFCGIRDWYDPTINERNIVFLFKTSTYTGTLNTNNVEGKVEWRRLDTIKEEEYASGLYNEMGLFFNKKINEYYSIYNNVNKIWENKEY